MRGINAIKNIQEKNRGVQSEMVFTKKRLTIRRTRKPEAYLCFADDMHPYNCLGKGKCIHCDKKTTQYHNPLKCVLCKQ